MTITELVLLILNFTWCIVCLWLSLLKQKLNTTRSMCNVNLRDSLNTFMMEFNSTLLEHHTNSQKIYMCGDYNVDLLKLNSIPFNETYFDNILSAGYIPKITLPTRLSENSTLQI